MASFLRITEGGTYEGGTFTIRESDAQKAMTQAFQNTAPNATSELGKRKAEVTNPLTLEETNRVFFQHSGRHMGVSRVPKGFAERFFYEGAYQSPTTKVFHRLVAATKEQHLVQAGLAMLMLDIETEEVDLDKLSTFSHPNSEGQIARMLKTFFAENRKSVMVEYSTSSEKKVFILDGMQNNLFFGRDARTGKPFWITVSSISREMSAATEPVKLSHFSSY